jgi:hypothetical protein
VSEQQEGQQSVPDEKLPEDLQPREDNPLAQPADDDVPDDILKDTSGGSSEDSEDDTQGGGGDSSSRGEASSESESGD